MTIDKLGLISGAPEALNELVDRIDAAISTAVSTEIVARGLAVSTAISSEVLARNSAVSVALSTALAAD